MICQQFCLLPRAYVPRGTSCRGNRRTRATLRRYLVLRQNGSYRGLTLRCVRDPALASPCLPPPEAMSSRNRTGDRHECRYRDTAFLVSVVPEFAPPPAGIWRRSRGCRAAHRYSSAAIDLWLTRQSRGARAGQRRLSVHVWACICTGKRPDCSHRRRANARVERDRDSRVSYRSVHPLRRYHVPAPGLLPGVRVCPADEAKLYRLTCLIRFPRRPPFTSAPESLLKLGPANPILRTAIRPQARASGFKVAASHQTLALSKGHRRMLLPVSHYPVMPSLVHMWDLRSALRHRCPRDAGK
jgi:hypothetical protein